MGYCCGCLFCLTQKLCFQLHMQIVRVDGAICSHCGSSLSTKTWSKSSVAFTVGGGERYLHHIYKSNLFIQQSVWMYSTLFFNQSWTDCSFFLEDSSSMSWNMTGMLLRHKSRIMNQYLTHTGPTRGELDTSKYSKSVSQSVRWSMDGWLDGLRSQRSLGQCCEGSLLAPLASAGQTSNSAAHSGWRHNLQEKSSVSTVYYYY